MNEIVNLTLAQIVTGNHRAAGVFEKYNLDFCCRGKRTLQQACVEKELKISEILAELDSVSGAGKAGEIDFNNLPLPQLIDYIVKTHHDYVKKELVSIFGLLQKISFKHGGRHPELVRVFSIFGAVREEMELHMKKEELILFPRIIEMQKFLEKGLPVNLSPNYIQGPVTIMEQEHEYAGNLMIEIRELTKQYTPPEEACATYHACFAALETFERDLHQHVHLENNILFPKAIRFFGIPSQSSLN